MTTAKTNCRECIHNKVCPWLDVTPPESCRHYLCASLCLFLPCPIGTPVFVIEECNCYSEKYAQNCQARTHANRTALEIAPLPSTGKSNKHTCLKMFRRAFKIDYLPKIGKTVFIGDNAEQEARNAINKRSKIR